MKKTIVLVSIVTLTLLPLMAQDVLPAPSTTPVLPDLLADLLPANLAKLVPVIYLINFVLSIAREQIGKLHGQTGVTFGKLFDRLLGNPKH